jgi:hypothetical protein
MGMPMEQGGNVDLWLMQFVHTMIQRWRCRWRA